MVSKLNVCSDLHFTFTSRRAFTRPAIIEISFPVRPNETQGGEGGRGGGGGGGGGGGRGGGRHTANYLL